MMRRYARQHDTAATQRHEGVRQEDWWEHPPGKRVLTVDGPGRVEAVHDGPFPGAEEYEIVLEGGLGGGLYGPGQITAALPTQASGHHTAQDDYPELGNLLHERPDPATMQYTAALTALGRSINGEEIDHHGTAPDWVRAANPNVYDQQSTEGEPDPDWLEDVEDRNKQVTASQPEDEKPDDQGEEVDEDNMCAYGHKGSCEEVHGRGSLTTESFRREAMPSRRYPEHPEGFETKVEPGHNQWEKNLVGYIHGQRVGHINYTPYDEDGNIAGGFGSSDDEVHKAHALKVNFLHTGRVDPGSAGRYNAGGEGKGVGSALMDHLYHKHPDAMINHGFRTGDGLKWWNSYDEPDPSRNVHNVQPHHWEHLFDRSDVAADINRNEGNDPGHHSEHHDVSWAHDHEHGYDDPDYDQDDYDREDKGPKEEKSKAFNPDPRDTELHHGQAVHLSPEAHRIVHNPDLPTEVRAHRLLDEIGRGNMEPHRWHRGGFRADADASVHANGLVNAGAHTPVTRVMLHAHPFEHNETHWEDKDGGEHANFENDEVGNSAHFDNVGNPINFHLKGVSWEEHGPHPSTIRHAFDKPEPVGMPLAQYHANDRRDSSHDNPAARVERADIRHEHEKRYRAPERHLNPPGTGDQQKLFAKQAHNRQMDPFDEHDSDAAQHHLVFEHGLSQEHFDGYESQDLKDEHEEQHRPEWDSGIKPTYPHEHASEKVRYEPVEMGGMQHMLNPGRGGRSDFSSDRAGDPFQSKEFELSPADRRGFFDPAKMSSLAALSDETKARLDQMSDHEVNNLDPTSDEHEYIHGFRQQRPDERHAEDIEGAAFTRDSLHERAAGRGHDLEWTPKNHGKIGWAPAWEGECNNCGHSAVALSGSSTSHAPHVSADARKSTCPGPGTKWQTEMQQDLLHQRMTDAVGQFGQNVKNEQDKHWLREQGIEASKHALSSLLITAAMDPEFRFQITASWRDVQNKARRIRAEGGVQITHATDAMVIGNVQGDHNVYESGLQRMPGKRTSVAQYSCGCKWGAYHWGASDDMSRFAGRMCSHALALQYEAQSRGMFGRDVSVDDTKPRWVPPKVVVKYDIDNGQHMRAESSLPGLPEPERTFPEHAPLMVVMALAADDDPAMPFLAAVNDIFGDNSGRSEPSLMDPMGATQPWDKNENPTSAGNLKAAEPDNWGSITNPSMFPSMASLIRTEAFWVKVAESAGQSDEGAEATLHEEPEGALPETDGTEHEASLGDVDIVNDGGLDSLADDELSPENLSIQTQGSAQDIVAEFQRSAGAQAIMSGAPKGQANDGMDLAAAAEAHLAKVASFSAAERQELINEAPGTQASNTDRLDIAGTHYADLENMDLGEDDEWMA